MPTRTLTAPQPGPVLIDTQLLGAAGRVTVRAEATCKAAEVTIRTADETGDAADAVRDADLRWDARGVLVAHVRGKGGATITSGGGVFVSGNVVGVVQTIHANYGSVIVSGGDLNLSGSGLAFSGGTRAVPHTSAIEIIALVPEGSSVAAGTQAADVVANGTFASVAADTQSGAVRVPGRADQVTAATQSGDIYVENAPHIGAKSLSGDIRLGRTDVAEADTQSGDITVRDFGGTARLKSLSGDINVHATAGGDIVAKTMSGDVTVTATAQAADDDVDVRATSMSGTVRLPRRPHSTGGPRRRRD